MDRVRVAAASLARAIAEKRFDEAAGAAREFEQAISSADPHEDIAPDEVLGFLSGMRRHALCGRAACLTRLAALDRERLYASAEPRTRRTWHAAG